MLFFLDNSKEWLLYCEQKMKKFCRFANFCVDNRIKLIFKEDSQEILHMEDLVMGRGLSNTQLSIKVFSTTITTFKRISYILKPHFWYAFIPKKVTVIFIFSFLGRILFLKFPKTKKEHSVIQKIRNMI